MILGVLAAGCLLDDDDRCGPNQQFSNDICICAEGTAYTPTGCVTCGENELASPTGCICVAGYVRPTPADVCMPIPQSTPAPTGGAWPSS